MRFSCAWILVIVVGTVACGSSAPETRYYRVANLSEPTPGESNLVIGVEPFTTDTAYDDQKMVYRKSPYRLDYYHYHRWATPPGIMLADYVREELENSGQFGAVLSGFTGDVTAMVGGRIIQFEEVDQSRDEWFARLKITIFVRDAQTGRLIWSRTLSESEPVEEQSPEGVARAMSKALQRAIGRNVADIARVSHETRERQIGNPTR